MPQRGAKHAFLELVERTRPLLRAALPRLEAQLEGDCRRARAGARAAGPPRRIESFDISHLQGSDTVAFDGCVEDGRMKNPAIASSSFAAIGNDDFASMQEVIERVIAASRKKRNLPQS